MTHRLHQIAESMTTSLVHSLQSGRSIFEHPTLKGDASEQCWIRWLSSLLPRRYGIERALIIDKDAKESEQIDIVIFDPQYTPVMYAEQGLRMLPAESVYAVFEVKQTLSAPHLVAAGQKAASVRRLHRTSAPITHAGGSIATPKTPAHIFAGILALESEWTSPLGKPLQSTLASAQDDERLDFGFAAQHGCFLRDVPPSPGAPPTWTTHPGEHQALRFLFGVSQWLASVGTVTAIDFTAYAASLKP